MYKHSFIIYDASLLIIEYKTILKRLADAKLF